MWGPVRTASFKDVYESPSSRKDYSSLDSYFQKTVFDSVSDGERTMNSSRPRRRLARLYCRPGVFPLVPCAHNHFYNVALCLIAALRLYSEREVRSCIPHFPTLRAPSPSLSSARKPATPQSQAQS